jgi:hypothetical protein
MSKPGGDRSGLLRRSQRKRFLVERWTDEQQDTNNKKKQSLHNVSTTTDGSQEEWCQNGPLCKQCESIDLEKLFRTYVETSSGVSVLEMGLITRDKVWKGCVLCRFLFQLRAEPGYGNTFHLRAFSSSTILTAARSGGLLDDVALSVETRKDSWEKYGESLSLNREHGLIVQEFLPPYDAAPVASHLYRGCQVDPLKVDYSRVQQWLKRCQDSHTNTCGRPGNPSMVKVSCIDCHTREVGEINTGDMYLALSYVWGPPSAHQHEETLTNPSSRLLPTTGVARVVEDAMCVVRELGLRYFWVDKYCIDQYDSDIRQQQIRAMDYVYEQAYATLIASTSKDAQSGLPGVGSTTRRLQPSVILQEKRFISTLPTLPSALKKSIWKTRGWTYQEFALSRRCLFFTDLQVYFLCSAMSCCESVVSGRGNTTLRAAEGGFLSVNIFEDTGPGPELRKFSDHLRQYTSRHLTLDSDALNAFRGFLARSKFWTYYGIPIAPIDSSTFIKTRIELDIGFARGLFWLPQGRGGWRFKSLSRRSSFPSWSWAGWKGAVEYPGVYGPAGGQKGGLMAGDRKNCDTTFWAEDHDGNLVTLEKLCSSSNQNRSILELSYYIHVDAWTFSLWFQPWQSRGENLIVCECHLDRAHHGILEYQHRWEDVILCESVLVNEAYYDRLVSKPWTCILLFNGVNQDNKRLHNLLVVDWNGDVAHRIGVITLRGGGVLSLDHLPGRKRQQIRLG